MISLWREWLNPEQFSDPKVIALQTALLHDRDPFCSGTCSIPGYQRLLYYTHGDLCRRVDFSNLGADDLEALYRACEPAEFGRNGENVLDESYRKAGSMDLTSFSMLLDPRRLGICEQVSKALLTRVQGYGSMDAELYKLNVYGKGDFFKAHKDTPRGQDMFGSLVIILPTLYEGGQLVLRHGGKEWTLDFADKLANATEPSVCFVAFFGDMEHEVLPVTSGYRVTLTYNLYHKPIHPTALSIPTPYHLKLKQALADVVNDKSKLPNGGYFGFGLIHEYVHTGHNILDLLLPQLKGSDRALADVCDELGLRFSLRLLYRGVTDKELDLVTTKELEVNESAQDIEAELPSDEYLRQALQLFTPEEAEGVAFVGERPRFGLSLLGDVTEGFGPEETEEAVVGEQRKKFDLSLVGDENEGFGPWLQSFYRTPATEVMEITPMVSLLSTKTLFMTYGNQPELEYFYGSACMLISVKPAESRDLVGM